MKYVPVAKRSKKEQRAYHSAQRGSWGGISPVTRKGKGSHDYKVKKANLKGVD